MINAKGAHAQMSKRSFAGNDLPVAARTRSSLEEIKKPHGDFSLSSPELAIEYLPTASLRLDPKNTRMHSNKQVQQIARSIETFGFNVPILVDAESQVIAGHGRLLA
jgi:hypothetical protein